MVKLLKKKAKALSPKQLADSLLQMGADADGITLEDYKRRQAIRIKSQVTYKKTHWVSTLTDAQKFLIATTTDVPHHYMDLPLSKGNETALAIFKKTSKNFKDWVVKNNKFMSKEFEIIKKASSNIAMETLRKEQRKLQDISLKLKQSLADEYQKVGRALRTKVDEKIHDFKVDYVTKFDDEFERKEKKRLVDASHGLNTLMTDNKLKRPLDIAPHYLKTHNEPNKADYFVDSFDNAVALANATGMLPQRMFKLVCDDLVKRKKHYEEQAFIKDGIKVEEIINLWEAKRAKNKTYSYSMFFKSNERKTWSGKYKWEWKSYKRFMEDFPKWIKIFTARAYAQGESDAEIMAEYLANPKN